MNIEQEFKKMCPKFGYLIYHPNNEDASLSEQYIHVDMPNIFDKKPMDFGDPSYCVVGEFHKYDKTYDDCYQCEYFAQQFVEDPVKLLIPEFVKHCKERHNYKC